MPPSHPSLDATRRALKASEARYRSLLESTPLPTWVHDRNTLRFLFVNRAMTSVYGWSADELARMTVADIGARAEVALEQRAEALAEPRNLGEFSHRRKDGGLLRVELHAHDVEFEGTSARVVVAMDVTARTRMEEELRQAHRDLEAAESAGQIGTWVSEMAPVARVRWSPETYRIFGVEAGVPMTVEGLLELVHPEDRAFLRRRRTEAFARRTVYEELEYRIVRGDATVRWVHTRASVERDGAGRPQRLLGTVQDVTDRRRAEDERDRFFSMAHDLFCIARGDRFVRVNRAFERVLGFTEEEMLARPKTAFIHPDDVGLTLREGAKLLEGEPLVRFINRYLDRDGAVRWLDWTAVRDPDTALIYATARDITQERAIQDRLEQSQKLEAIGQLAGGIAHDFNNILSVIRGGAELLRSDLGPEDPLYTDAGEIIAASARAANLTRQLLAFSRRQLLQPVVLDVNELVGAAAKLLRRLIGEHIELSLRLSAEPMRTRADPGQLEQVLINLAVNARDAMPDGGRLGIETRRVTLEAEYAPAYAHIGLAPGPYLEIAVSDGGQGMDREVLKRVFEPFFTTKEAGKAIGLGLATAYGIVRQSGGGMWVYSEPGVGTTFKIYLPRLEAEGAATEPPPAPTEARGRGETVLLVEDEPMVRHLVHRVLQRAGFDVLEASNGGDALMVAEQHQGALHVLLTDVVMPRMSGRQLAERLQAWHPKLRVVYMSGYTEDAIIHQGVLDRSMNFVAKPISPAELVRKIREVLDLP